LGFGRRLECRLRFSLWLDCLDRVNENNKNIKLYFFKNI
jgi:hypothetical protein